MSRANKMLISTSFNGFLHSILTEAYNKARDISFREWQDTDTGGCLIFYKDEDYSDMDELKQLFKLLNIDYPLSDNGEGKLSTRDITNKELCRHIVFVEKILNENGIEFQHNIDEYERIKFEAGIEK
jgi:hypothetical protein